MRRSVMGLIAFVGVLTFGIGAPRAEPLKIRQGWVNLTSILAPIVFEKKDLMTHYGKTYVVEPMHFASSSAQLTALAAGDLDITVGGPITLAHAIQNAGLTDIRVIADGFQDGVDGYFSSRYLVRADSGIKTIEDLKGKVLTSNGLGGTMDIVIRAAMAEHHMVAGRDYTIVEAELAAQNAMLLEGKVALISSMPPFAYDPKIAGKTRVLFTMKQIMGRSQMTILFARESFLKKNHDAITDYFEDAQRGVHWFLDPANRQAMLDLAARVTKRPRESYARYLYTKDDYYHDPKMLPNVAAIQHDIDTLHKLGYIKSDFDVKKYTDLSFVDAAAKRN